MISLQTVQLWSDSTQAIVEWTIGTEEETDEGGNVSTVIVARYNDEIHKFSPSYGDEELLKLIDEMNKEHQ